ncbi:hypothetical protein HOY80DRAFT_1004199 [Tuber brumale]|nr:hypothetical protein HOY80DRAFT_1004199 [Tuber brumale]
MQPKDGWKEVERKLYGYACTNKEKGELAIKQSWDRGKEFQVPDFGKELEVPGVEKQRLELPTCSKKQKSERVQKLRVDRLLQLLNPEIRRGRSQWVADSITISATIGMGKCHSRISQPVDVKSYSKRVWVGCGYYANISCVRASKSGGEFHRTTERTMLHIVPTLREYDDGGEILKEQLPWALNANDNNQYSWKPKGTEWLQPKGKGKGLMVSEFLTEAQERLHYYDKANGTKFEASEILKYGKNHQGW